MLRPYFTRPVLKSVTKKKKLSTAEYAEKIRNTTCKRPNRETGKRVRINVSGKHFETYMKTLQSKKDSIFNKDSIEKYYDTIKDEYYFDRDASSFKAILTYMQCGVVNKPDDTTLKIFTEELKFFGFLDQALRLLTADSDVAIIYKYDSLKRLGFRKYIWQILGNHNVNLYSQLLSAFCSLVTILWIGLICITTIPAFKKYKYVYRIIETFCVSWFTFEILIRLCFSPSKWRFCLDWLNIVDIMSLLPFYIAINKVTDSENHDEDFLIKLVRLVGITRIIRAFRVYKNSKVIRVIMLSAYSSQNELCLVGFFIGVQMILFASAVFHFEHEVNGGSNGFESIPHVFWFCMVTITTVGYGDMTPITIGGKFCTGVLAVLSTLVIALPTSIIVNNFLISYKAVMKSNKEEIEGLEYNVEEVEVTEPKTSNSRLRLGSRRQSGDPAEPIRKALELADLAHLNRLRDLSRQLSAGASKPPEQQERPKSPELKPSYHKYLDEKLMSIRKRASTPSEESEPSTSKQTVPSSKSKTENKAECKPPTKNVSFSSIDQEDLVGTSSKQLDGNVLPESKTESYARSNDKSNDKSETKSETKSDIRSDIKSDTNSDKISDTKLPESKIESKTKSEVKSNKNSENKSDIKSKNIPDKKSDTKSEKKSDINPDSKRNKKSDTFSSSNSFEFEKTILSKTGRKVTFSISSFDEAITTAPSQPEELNTSKTLTNSNKASSAASTQPLDKVAAKTGSQTLSKKEGRLFSISIKLEKPEPYLKQNSHQEEGGESPSSNENYAIAS